jgi:glycosyltransferase involved in cell wall biosynthesis
MACARPAIGADVLGPASIIDQGETGWLFERDDEQSLARVLAEVVNEDQERRRRGERARQVALERYSWLSLGARVDTVLREAIAEGVPG